MKCLTPEQIEALASGAVKTSAAHTFRLHLAQCPACRNEFEACRANERFLVGLRADGLVGSNATSSTEDATEAMGGDPSRMTAAEPPPPDSIPGYTIVREIHRGGQGVVYEAEQVSTRRRVAIKVLLEGLFAGERTKWRFEREVKLAAALKHPNIVVIHESGVAQGRHYCAMDFVKGRHLDAYVREQGLAPRETVRLFLSVCDAVAYAHRRGIIHRDLKPPNIKVSEEGDPMVLDFGLAKAVGENESDDARAFATITGQITGTIRYMAPEQTLGRPELISVQTDIYALGVILYELLTGKAPYETDGDLAIALKNIREKDPPVPLARNRGADSELNAIVLRAMHKEPQRRYQSAGELANDLRAWLEGRPVTAKSDSSLYVLRKLALRHRFETAVVVALSVALVSLATVGLQIWIQAGRRVAAAESDKQASQTAYGHERDLTNMATGEVIKLARELRLAWFLVERNHGQIDRASEIRSQTAQGTLYRKVMDFLLTEAETAAGFEAGFNEPKPPLVYYAIGEKLLVRGEKAAAVQAFHQCTELAKTSHDDWWESAGRSRLSQLQGTSYGNGRSPSSVPAE